MYNHKPQNRSFSRVKGQYHVRRAVEVVAAGGHNLLRAVARYWQTGTMLLNTSRSSFDRPNWGQTLSLGGSARPEVMARFSATQAQVSGGLPLMTYQENWSMTSQHMRRKPVPQRELA